MKQKLTSTIAGASVFIAFISLVSRSIGFLREIVFAGFFGTGEDFDLFLVGTALPVTISTAIYFIGQNFFIPAYNHIRVNKENDLDKFISNSFYLFVFSGLVITLILFLTAVPVVNIFLGSHSAYQRDIAYNVFRVFIFAIPFSSGVAILSAYLHSVYEFKYPSLSILVLNISTIVFVLFFGRKTGVLIIAIGYLTGSVFQFVYLLIKSRMKLRMPHLLPSFNKIKNETDPLINVSFIIIILIETISQLFMLFDRYFYSEVSSGGIAAINYAQILFLLPISILSMALATAIFPKLTSALKINDSEEVRRIFFEASRVILLLFLPVSFLFIFYPEQIVSLIFMRGNFTSVSTAYTSQALMYLSFSLVFYAVYSVINKIFYSAGLIKTLFVITIAGSFIKFILNYLLVEGMEQNGLAAGSAFTYFFFFLSCLLILNFKLKLNVIARFGTELLWMLLNSFLAYTIAGYLAGSFFVDGTLSDILFIVFFISGYLLNLILAKHTSLIVFRNFYLRIISERKSIFT